MSNTLARALARRSEADDRIERTLKCDYPLDAHVEWKRNSVHEGIVIGHGTGDRIKVRNIQSGHEVWIYAFNIVDALQSRTLTT